MSNCRTCGKPLPSFSFGKLQDQCKECRSTVFTPAGVGSTANINSGAAASAPARRVSLRSLTPVTSVLIGINAVVLLAMALTGGFDALADPANALLLRWGADWGPLTLGPEPWRAFTSMWVHAGIIHLFFNMWCLDVYGRVAERVFGWRTFLLVYITTGLCGALTSLAYHPTVVSVGASAAIFGIVGALVMPYRSGKLPLSAEALKRASKSLVSFIGYNLLIGMAVPVIDNSAHVGGLVGGLAIGWLWAKSSDTYRRDFVRRAGIAAVIFIAAAFATIHQVRQWNVKGIQAAEALDRGNADEAINDARDAVAHNSKDAISYSVLGAAYEMKSQPDAAIAAFQKALAADPDNEYSLARLGYLYSDHERYSDAVTVLEHAVKVDNKDANAWTDLAWAYWQLHREGAGMDAIHTAIQKDASNARAHFYAGEFYSDRGDEDNAMAQFKEAVKLEPKAKDYASALADLYDRKKLHDDAAAVRHAAGISSPK